MKLVNLKIGNELRIRQMGITVSILIQDITLFTWGEDLRFSVHVIHTVIGEDGVTTQQGMDVVGDQLAHWLKDGEWEVV